MVWGVVRDASGRLWIATNEGLNSFNAETSLWSSWPQTRGHTHSIAATPDGKVWASVLENGILCLDPATGAVIRPDEKSGLPARFKARGLAVDEEHRLWILSDVAVFRGHTSRNQQFDLVPNPANSPGVEFYSAVQDKLGRMWIASSNGLFRLDKGLWTRFSTRDGLISDVIGALALKGDNLWVAYQEAVGLTHVNGLDRGKPAFHNFTSGNGLPTDNLYSLGISNSTLWVGSDLGLLIFRDGTWHNYTHADGLIWDDCDSEGILAEADGVWISTSRGLSHLKISPSNVLDDRPRDRKGASLGFVR